MPQFVVLNPLWLWALLLVPVLLIGPLRRPAGSRRAAIVTAVVRCLVLGLMVAALADVRWPRARVSSDAPPVLVVEDASGSVTGDPNVAALRDKLLARVPAGRPVEKLRFAAAPWRDGDKPTDASATNIEQALDVAPGTRGDLSNADVLLLTDGRQTQGDAAAAATRLAARGARVNVVPVGRGDASGVQLVAVEPPIDARIGSPAAVRVSVRSAAAAPVTVTLTKPDGTTADERTMTVNGEATALLRYGPTEPGLAPCGVSVTAAGHPPATRPAAFDVEGPPKLLIVDRAPDQATALASAAEGLRLPVETVTPDKLPADLSPYAAVVLSDLVGDEFSTDQRLALKQFVEDRGSGLVFIGGGDVKADRWNDNPLAQLLPVRLKPPPAKVITKPPEVSICFVIDTSGSMSDGLPGNNPTSKLGLVKQAVMASLASLPQEARISIVGFDNDPRLILDAASVANADLIAPIVQRIDVGGGTNLFPGVQSGLEQLEKQAGDKFIVVLTDGRSRPPPGGKGWGDLAIMSKRMSARWTSVAVGQDADQDLLRTLATAAGGNFRFCGTGDDVPRVFIDQAKSIKRVADLKRPAFSATPGPDARDLKQFVAADLPPLNGQVITEPKGGSRVLLSGENGKPLLSSWQAGAGRVLAFAGDAKTLWASDWLTWPDFSKFWSDQIGTVASAPPPLRAKVRSTRLGDRTRFTFTVTDEKGRPADGLTYAAKTIDGPPAEVSWRQPQPGTFEATARTDAVSTMRFSLNRGDKRGIGYVATLAGSTTAEYGLLGPDAAACEALAAAGDGVCTDDVDTLARQLDRPPIERRWTESLKLWPYLLAAALLFWPLDVWARKVVV